MHAFFRGFGFRSHAHFCFHSKVATTRPFLHLPLIGFSLPPKWSVTFVFFFIALSGWVVLGFLKPKRKTYNLPNGWVYISHLLKRKEN
jgi:hypothetical protein